MKKLRILLEKIRNILIMKIPYDERLAMIDDLIVEYVHEKEKFENSYGK